MHNHYSFLVTLFLLSLQWSSFSKLSLVYSFSVGTDPSSLINNTIPEEVRNYTMSSGSSATTNSSNDETSVWVSPLDPEEEAEFAKIEEEEMEKEIEKSEQELKEILNALDEREEMKKEEDEGVHNNPPVSSTLEPENEEEIIKRREQEIKAKAVENLMQIFGISPTPLTLEDLSKPPPRLGPPPEFMIELYNTITDSSGITRAKNPYKADVVRSFLEKKQNDTYPAPLLFNFNITTLMNQKEEEVLEAELHLFRREVPRAQLHPSLYLNPFYVLSLYQVKDPSKIQIPALHKLLGVHYVPALGSGWEVFNVKKAVSEWLSEHSENHGFLVSAENVYGDKVPIQFARRKISEKNIESKQPILVLFNENVDPTPPPTKRPVMKQPKETVHEGEEEGGGSTDSQEHESNTTPHQPLSSLENPRFHHSLLFHDSIRHPNSVGRYRSRRSRNETAPIPLTSQNSSTATNLTQCSRHDLYVSFESIGWSSWIISPKGYNAHYCDGPCVFPLGKEVKPTNHATVQSIINELNLHPGLRTRPCCVPSTLLPISLLYYDDNDNVVLKQYVDMVAESCGCQ